MHPPIPTLDTRIASIFTHTDNLLIIAGSGITSQPVGLAQGSAEDQVAYLNAVHAQLGLRLTFWVDTLFDDFNLDSYAAEMKKQGRDPQDAPSLGAFAHTGLRNSNGSPIPALEVWESFRDQ